MRHLIPLLALVACAPSEDDAATDTDTDVAAATDGFDTDAEELAVDALLSHLEALQGIADAHDGHRALGSDGYDASVEHARAFLEDLGLDVRLETFEVSDWAFEGLSVLADGVAVDEDDLGLLSGSPGGDVTGTVVPVDLDIPPGPGDVDSGCEAAHFTDFPAGAVALIQRGTCTFSTKVANAEAAGAVGVIVMNGGEARRTGAFDGGLDPEDPPGIPAVAMSYDAGVLLAEADTVRIDLDADNVAIASTNVLVDVPGRQPTRWIVGAHLDSVPEGPGINDNGTGVATVLQLAELWTDLPEREHGVTFALWGAEEVGLVGSLHHAGLLEEDGFEDVLGNLNFDMVGSPNAGRFVYDGDGSDSASVGWLPLVPGSADIEQRFLDHFADRDLATGPSAYDGRSDYAGFAMLGLPTGGLFTGAEAIKLPSSADAFGGASGEAYDACYHRACDDIDNLDLDILVEMAVASGDVLYQLTGPDGAPDEAATLAPAPLPPSAPVTCHGHERVEATTR